MNNSERRNRVRRRYRAKEREDENQLRLPSREEMLAKAQARLGEYVDDLEHRIRAIRNGGGLSYDYALETAQVAIRLAAQVAAVDDIKDIGRAA